MINRSRLHRAEMDLIYLLENKELTREDIMNHFTDLMSEVKE